MTEHTSAAVAHCGFQQNEEPPTEVTNIQILYSDQPLTQSWTPVPLRCMGMSGRCPRSGSRGPLCCSWQCYWWVPVAAVMGDSEASSLNRRDMLLRGLNPRFAQRDIVLVHLHMHCPVKCWHALHSQKSIFFPSLLSSLCTHHLSRECHTCVLRGAEQIRWYNSRWFQALTVPKLMPHSMQSFPL